MRQWTWFPLCLAAAAGFGGAAAARAEEPPKPGADAKASTDASDDAAKAALERFAKDFARDGEALRIDAVKALSKTVHPTVASELFEVALKGSKDAPKGDDQARLRTYAFKGLAAQKSSLKTLGPRLSKFLGETAEEGRKRKAKGDYGVRVDPKTGRTDEVSEEGKAALKAKRERAAMIAEAMKVHDASGHRGKDDVEMLAEFLGDGNDDVVASALGMLARWKEWTVLPALLDLYELYPSEDKVEVGSTAVDTGSAGSADQQAAKRAWMAKYGDPDRRRARPVVVRALRQALTDITGEKFETPAALREFLRKPDVKRKVKTG